MLTTESITIRTMTPSDWSEVAEIYASGIATGMATFETQVPSWDDWDASHLPFGRIVALYGDIMQGWAALSPVSKRYVYRGVAEVSVYVAAQARGKGVGNTLLQSLITESEAHGIWTLQAGIFRENEVSIKLHERNGFRVIGYREKVGKLHGVWKDNLLLERRSKRTGVD